MILEDDTSAKTQDESGNFSDIDDHEVKNCHQVISQAFNFSLYKTSNIQSNLCGTN